MSSMNGGQEKLAGPKAPTGEGNKLIQEKKQVQLELKDLNRRIKELKQLLRGGRIDEPLNPALPSLADKIVQDLGHAAGEVKELAKEQGEYVAKQESRKGRVARPAEPPVADVPSQPAEQKLELPPALLQAASLELPPHLASSRWSRFKHMVKTPFQLGDKSRWERLRLLRTAADINDALKDIENAVLTGQEIGIPTAVYKAGALYHIIEDSVIERLLFQITGEPTKERGEDEEEEPEAGPSDETATPAPTGEPELTRQEEADLGATKLQIRQNIEGYMTPAGESVAGYQQRWNNADSVLAYLKIMAVAIPEEIVTNMGLLRQKYITSLKSMVGGSSQQKTVTAPSPQVLRDADERVKNALYKLEAQIMNLGRPYGVTLGTNGLEISGTAQAPGLGETEKAIPEPAPVQPKVVPDLQTEGMSIDDMLEKMAQSALDRRLTHNVLTRYLKRKWVSVFGGPTRELRLSAAKSAREAREELNGFMDAIEEGKTFREIGDRFIGIIPHLRRLYLKLISLGDEFNKYVKLERQHRRQSKERITIEPIQKMELNQLNQLIGTGGKFVSMAARLAKAIGNLPEEEEA